MTRAALAGLATLVALAQPAWAKWASLSLEEAVAQADAVVVGSLKTVGPADKGILGSGSGLLEVEEILYGEVKKGDLKIGWRILGACGPAVHAKDGERRIWLLKEVRPGWRVDHPDQVRAMGDLDAVRRRLAVWREMEAAPGPRGLSLVGTYSIQREWPNGFVTILYRVAIRNHSKEDPAVFVHEGDRFQGEWRSKALFLSAPRNHQRMDWNKTSINPGGVLLVEGRAHLESPRGKVPLKIPCVLSAFRGAEAIGECVIREFRGVDVLEVHGELSAEGGADGAIRK